MPTKHPSSLQGSNNAATVFVVNTVCTAAAAPGTAFTLNSKTMGHISTGEGQDAENKTPKGATNRKGKLSQIEHYHRALEQLAKVKMAKSAFVRW